MPTVVELGAALDLFIAVAISKFSSFTSTQPLTAGRKAMAKLKEGD